MWVKHFQSTASLLVGAVLSITSLFIPPEGEIAESVIIMTAQFLIFTATMEGVELRMNRLMKLFRKKNV